jgi:hypothetical protein
VAALERDAAVVGERQRQQLVRQQEHGCKRRRGQRARSERRCERCAEGRGGAGDADENEKADVEKSGGEGGAALEPLIERGLSSFATSSEAAGPPTAATQPGPLVVAVRAAARGDAHGPLVVWSVSLDHPCSSGR